VRHRMRAADTWFEDRDAPSQLGFERNKWRRLGGNSRLHIYTCRGESDP
jgi:hypothetical protein